MSFLCITDWKIIGLNCWLKMISQYLAILPSMKLHSGVPSHQVNNCCRAESESQNTCQHKPGCVELSVHSPLHCTNATSSEEKSKMTYQYICFYCFLASVVSYFMKAVAMTHALSLCISMWCCLWLNSHLNVLISPQNWNS